jgi:phosphate:Na+ symporter
MNTGPAILAGFGLFFVGIRLISSHMQQMATRRVRQILGRAMMRRGVAPLAGLGLGALVQSTTGVTFIIISLLTSGLLAMGPALSMLAWSNVGTSVLVLLSTIDLKTMALYLIGLIGISYLQGLDRSPHLKHMVAASLGVGLLFLGLSLVKEGFADLRGNPWVEEFILFSGESGMIALLVGLVAAIAAQSSATVTILALPLVHAGVADQHQVTLLVYGASVGSGLAVMLLSSNLEGTSRQLGLYQACLKLLAAAIFVPLYYVERLWDVPLVHALAGTVSHSPTFQVAVIYLIFQIGAALMGNLLQGPLQKLLASMSPPTAEEALMRPHYLFDEAIGDPDTALDLVDREQQRLISALPAYVDTIRSDGDRPAMALPLSIRHAASTAVAGETDVFLSEVVNSNPGFDGVDRIFEARSRLRGLVTLQECLHEFASHMASLRGETGSSLKTSLIESLHLLLTMAAEVAQTGDEDDRAFLEELTSDRSDMMEGIRRQLLAQPASASMREALLVATVLFERAVWLIRELRMPETQTARIYPTPELVA